jgi:hypothetical protein
VLASDGMITFSFSFGVVIWLDTNTEVIILLDDNILFLFDFDLIIRLDDNIDVTI